MERASDYSLTDKGGRVLDGPSKLSDLKEEILESVGLPFVRAVFSTPAELRALRSLEKSGLIKKDSRDVSEMLLDLRKEDPAAGRALSIYTRLSRNSSSVRDNELDWLRDYLARKLVDAEREFDWTSTTTKKEYSERSAESLARRLRSANTKKDKVLAIDEAAHLIHYTGSILSTEGNYPSKVLSLRILNRLAE